MSTTPDTVTAHDKAVLSRIFNPNLPYGDTVEESEQELENDCTLGCMILKTSLPNAYLYVQ